MRIIELLISFCVNFNNMQSLHLFKKTAYNAGNAGEEETSREQGLPPYDVHHQQDQDVGRDLWESFSFERQM